MVDLDLKIHESKLMDGTWLDAHLIFKSGFVDLDLTIFWKVEFGLDLSFFKRADLDLKIGLDLDLNIAGFAHHWGKI